MLDSSAIVAVLFLEAGHEQLVSRMNDAAVVLVGAPTLVETSMVLTREFGLGGRQLMEEMLNDAGAEVVPFSRLHYEVATEAFLRFGKGRHPARLNFGDCMSYAVATVSGMPLLFTGDDFPQTDVKAAIELA